MCIRDRCGWGRRRPTDLQRLGRGATLPRFDLPQTPPLPQSTPALSPKTPTNPSDEAFLPSCGGFMFVMTAPFGSCETHKLTWLQSCQPWSYLRLVAYSFVGLCEGA